MINPMPTVPKERVSEAIIAEALGRIPPLWPLKHFVAVNPFVGLLGLPFTEACATFQRATGCLPLLTPREYADFWRQGVITPADLDAVSDAEWTRDRLVEFLTSNPDGRTPPLSSFADFLDHQTRNSHWSSLVVEEISKWCAVSFDQNQTTWKSPWRENGLYANWKAAACLDLNPEAHGLRHFRQFVAELPEESGACIRRCVEQLSPAADLLEFLHRQLATVSGWAGYLQYRVREEELRGRRDDSLRDLLAIRLAFDAALYAALGNEPQIAAGWRKRAANPSDPEFVPVLFRWQLAYEHGYQRNLARRLTGPRNPKFPGRPAVQAVFCIDVRSEVFRRQLEAALPGLQSIGFAGFFGFPVAHRSASGDVGSRCPVLLVPPVESHDGLPAAVALSTRSSLAEAEAWRAFQNSATSCFSFVETVGIGFGAALNRPTAGSARSCSSPPPVLTSGAAASLENRAAMAEGALRNMGLTGDFARLVLLCGHGSQSANNPYGSGLDCGACGGHAGDVNARLAASSLNDAAVRELLRSKGIHIPADTYFVAGLHNTTTDEVTLFGLAEAPGSHLPELRRLRGALALAGNGSRRERAAALSIGAGTDESRMKAFARRAADISEVRPEWGLANNAAFVAAPRSRTAAHNLEGRVFLHDYDASADPDGKVLALILCAPVVVASWINLQYYGSRVNPEALGSGNKVLHNVVGGFGVVEGNGGDLKTGLPLQSIHDGQKFVHEPRRLSVFIEASRVQLDAVLNANRSVKQLFDHQWIHLFSLQDGHCQRYTKVGWRPLA